MFIQTEQTPNPAVLKFLPGQELHNGGPQEFKSADEAGDAPLAIRLFGIDQVEGVFIARDYVSVTKGEAADWQDLKAPVIAALMDHFASGEQAVTVDLNASSADEDDDEIVLQIKELLDTRVRPAVAQDGGDIQFHGFDKGIVYLKMRGACAGCPSSTATLKMGIERMLQHFIPEVVEVRPVAE